MPKLEKISVKDNKQLLDLLSLNLHPSAKIIGQTDISIRTDDRLANLLGRGGSASTAARGVLRDESLKRTSRKYNRRPHDYPGFAPIYWKTEICPRKGTRHADMDQAFLREKISDSISRFASETFYSNLAEIKKKHDKMDDIRSSC